MITKNLLLSYLFKKLQIHKIMNKKNRAISRTMEIYLKIIGCYSEKRKLKGFIIIFTSFVIFLPFQILYNIQIYNNIDNFVANFACLSVTVTFLAKLGFFRLNRRNIRFLLKVINDDFEYFESNEEKMKMKKNMKLYKRIHVIISIVYKLMSVVAFGSSLSSYYETKTIENTQYILPATFPFLKKTWRNFVLISLMNFMQILILTEGHITSESIFALTVFHAATKAHSVRLAIKQYSKSCIEGDEICIKKATYNVHCKHRNYLEFAKNVENLYSFIVLCTLYGAGIQLCVSGCILITAIERKSISFKFLYLNTLLANLCTVGIYCAVGDYFTLQSEHIYKDLCECPWYMFNIEDAKKFLFFVSKIQKLTILTVGKFGHLSLVYFTLIMRVSFSLLTVFSALLTKTN